MSLTVLWVGIMVVLLIVVGILKSRFGMPFSIRLFIAMLLGMVLGLFVYFSGEPDEIENTRQWFALVGYGYIDLLRMLIIPLIPTSIIAGLMKLQNTQELKQMGGRTLGMFFITATLASIIGLLVASAMNIGAGMAIGNLSEQEPQTIMDILSRFRNFIPSNPVESAANMELIPLVVFSILVGIAAVIESGRNRERIEPFRAFVEALLQVVIRLTKLVIRLTPYGVVGLMAYWMSYTGISAISDLALFVVSIVLACLVQILVVYGGALAGIARINPFRFYRAASPAMLLAFTSRSSLGTLTLTVSTMINRLKVRSRYANFVGPIGAVMNMDACGGIYPAMVSVFAANAFGIELTMLQYGLIVVVSILASIGSAAVPMGATTFTIVTLSTVGLPVEAIGLVAGVDFLVDMFRTSTNVTGDLTTSVVAGSLLGEFDRDAFNEQDLSVGPALEYD